MTVHLPMEGAARVPPIFVEVSPDGMVTPMPRDRLLAATPAELSAIADRIGWPVGDVASLLLLSLGGTVVTHWGTPSPLLEWARTQNRIRHVGNGVPAEGLPRSPWHSPFAGDPVAYGDYLLSDRPDLAARISELRCMVLACDCAGGETCHARVLVSFADLRLASELTGQPLPVGTRLDQLLAPAGG